MDNNRITTQCARIATIAVIVSLVSGCATASKAADWLRGRDELWERKKQQKLMKYAPPILKGGGMAAPPVSKGP